MTILEKAVSDLAGALENLESKLDERIDGGDADRDTAIAASRQAKAAHAQTSQASEDIAAAIDDVKTLLATGGKG